MSRPVACLIIGAVLLSQMPRAYSLDAPIRTRAQVIHAMVVLGCRPYDADVWATYILAECYDATPRGEPPPDPLLVVAIISVESNFHERDHYKGNYCGLMQISLRVHRRAWPINGHPLRAADLYEPQLNIRIGITILRAKLAKYHSVERAVTAYNVGHWPGHANAYCRKVLKRYRQVTP